MMDGNWFGSFGSLLHGLKPDQCPVLSNSYLSRIRPTQALPSSQQHCMCWDVGYSLTSALLNHKT